MKLGLGITINKSNRTPVYKQVTEQIISEIKSGKIMPGTRLPSERDLALELGLSRGTVQKAYIALIQQKHAQAVKGKGTFVSTSAGQEAGESRLSIATSAINNLLSQLEELDFSHKEISTLFSSLMAERTEMLSRFSIAIVDCNQEAREIFQKQISLLQSLRVSKIDLAQLKADSNPAKLLENFDLVVTTTTHLADLQQLAPKLGKKLIPVSVSPASETMVSLGSISPNNRVMVLHYSDIFFRIIKTWVTKFHPGIKCEGLILEQGNSLENFITSPGVLIIPPAVVGNLNKDDIRIIQNFRQTGGKLLQFQYQIEQGSLVLLESHIKALLNQQR
jgi:GntR family transcriptional regulator